MVVDLTILTFLIFLGLIGCVAYLFHVSYYFTASLTYGEVDEVGSQ